MTAHIPNPHEQIVRYYGWYSNASRGKKGCLPVNTRLSIEGSTHADVAAQEFARRRRRNWARFLCKVYQKAVNRAHP